MSTQKTEERQEHNLTLAPSGKDDVRSFIESEETITAIEKVAGGMIDPVQMVAAVCQTVLRTPDLMKCTKLSLYSAMMRLSQVGCIADGVHGYIVPMKTKDEYGYYTVPSCIGVETSRGLLRVFRINGIKGVHAEVVRKNDAFEWRVEDGELRMNHVPDLWGESEIVGFYFVWELNGRKEGVTMSKKEVDVIMARTKSKDNGGKIIGPWVTDYAQMGLKTVIKRGAKYIPLPVSVAQGLLAIDKDEYEDMRNITPPPPRINAPIDPTLPPPVEDEEEAPADESASDLNELPDIEF